MSGKTEIIYKKKHKAKTKDAAEHDIKILDKTTRPDME